MQAWHKDAYIPSKQRLPQNMSCNTSEQASRSSVAAAALTSRGAEILLRKKTSAADPIAQASMHSCLSPGVPAKQRKFSTINMRDMLDKETRNTCKRCRFTFSRHWSMTRSWYLQQGRSKRVSEHGQLRLPVQDLGLKGSRSELSGFLHTDCYVPAS